MFLAVPIVMFYLVTLIFECIEAFIFDFPSASGTFYQPLALLNNYICFRLNVNISYDPLYMRPAYRESSFDLAVNI